MAGDKRRDFWDRLQILLDPFGKLLTGLIVVVLGIYGNRALQEDQKRRAYVELLSRREEADGNLRKDMFGKVIDQFVTPNKGDLDNRILNLELLAYNFHESIDLGPLLKQVYSQSWADKSATSRQRKRLQNLAQEIVSRELVALAAAGCIDEGTVHFDQLERNLVQADFIQMRCAEKNGLPAKTFRADVMTNPQATELRRQTEVDVVLTVQSPKTKQTSAPDQHFEFTVSPFDFPLIDNVRLGDRGRAAMVMTRVDDGGVTLALVYFPDSRTSLRDKPFQDEVMKTMQMSGK